MASPINLLLPILLLILTAFSSPENLVSAQSQPPFTCRTAATCSALIDYVTTNATTLANVSSLFAVTDFRRILGVNDLPTSTPPSRRLPAQSTVRIPFPCLCSGSGTGRSHGGPNYTVVAGDTLSRIATEVFSNLVTYQQIAVANSIPDPNQIDLGQNLQIPLPCSCDAVGGQAVVHYGHVVTAGSSVAAIAAQFNISQQTLWTLNDLNSTSSLTIQAGFVLDVPLTACNSTVNSTSPDYPLLVPNGTYQFTANDCVQCRCDAGSSLMLHCQASLINSTCGPIRCDGAGSLLLGNSTTSGCNRTTCAYAGYSSRGARVLTTLASESICPAPSSGMSLRGGRWNEAIILIQILMFSFIFLM